MNFVDIFTLILTFAGIALAGSVLFYGLIFGAMYMRIPTKKLKKIIEMGKLTPKKRVYDLGAGLGTISFEAAFKGARVTAIEVDPLKIAAMKMMLWYQRRAYKFSTKLPMPKPKGIKDLQMEVVKANLLNVDLHKADVVYCYLFGPLMQKVGEKARKEMHSGSLLISVEHPIKRWKPSYVDSKDKIFMYKIPNAFAVEV